MNSDLKPPFSRTVLVNAVVAEGQSVSVEASPDERSALAEIDGLEALQSLIGQFRLTSLRSGGVRVVGTVRARVMQICTVSLDPFEADLAEDVDVTFLPEKALDAWKAAHRREADAVLSAEDDDPPDAILDGRIDLGVLAAEFMALGLDPYPRKPGVAFDLGTAADEKDPSPFAALASLKRDL